MKLTLKRPHSKMRWMTFVGALVALLALCEPALACINAWSVVAEGVFPEMFWVWLGALAIVIFVVLIDRRRDEPLSTRSRIYVAVAIFVMLSAVKLIHYGVTVDPDEWRLWDLHRYEQQEQVPHEIKF